MIEDDYDSDEILEHQNEGGSRCKNKKLTNSTRIDKNGQLIGLKQLTNQLKND